MDDFEVIYTEDDIKAVNKKFEEVSSKYVSLLKEKKETEVFVGALKDKIKSYETLNREYQETKDLMSSQKSSLEESQRRQEQIITMKNEQDGKLIKALKEKHVLEQNFEKVKNENAERSLLMAKEMEAMKNKMTAAFAEQSKVQQEAAKTEIIQLQKTQQNLLLQKQIELEEYVEESETTKKELGKATAELKENKAKLEYSSKRLMELSEQVAAMKSKEEDLKNTLKKCEQKEASLLKELEILRQENQNLMNKLKEERDGIKKIASEADKNKNSLQITQEQTLEKLEAAQQKCAVLQSQIETSESTIGELFTKISELEKSLETQSKQSALHIQQLEKSNQEALQLKEEIQKVSEKAKHQVLQTKAEAEKIKAEAQLKTTQAQSEIEAARKEILANREYIAIVNAEKESALERVGSILENVKTIQQEKEEIFKKFESERVARDKKETELEKQTDQLRKVAEEAQMTAQIAASELEQERIKLKQSKELEDESKIKIISELTNAQDSNRQLKEINEQFRSQLHQLEKQQRDCAEKLKIMVGIENNSNEKLQESELIHQTLSKNNKDLQDQLKVAEEENTHLKNNKAHLMEDWQALQKEKKNIEDEFKENYQALLSINETNAQLQNENAHLRNQITELQKVISEQLAKIDILVKQSNTVQELSDAKQKLKGQVNILEEELGRNKQKLETEVKILKEEQAKRETENTLRLVEEKDKYAKKVFLLEEAEKEYEKKEKENELLKAELQKTLIEKKQAIESAKAEVEHQKNKAIAQSQEIDGTMKELVYQNQKLKDQQKLLEEDIQSMTMKLDEQAEVIESSQQQNNLQNAKNDDEDKNQKVLIAEYNQQLVSLAEVVKSEELKQKLQRVAGTNSVQDLKDASQELRKTIGSIIDDRSNKEQKLTELQHGMTQLTEKLEKDAIDIDFKQAEINRKNEEIKQLTEELAQKNQTLISVTAEKDSLAQENSQLKDYCFDIGQNLQKSKDDNNSNSLQNSSADMFAEFETQIRQQNEQIQSLQQLLECQDIEQIICKKFLDTTQLQNLSDEEKNQLHQLTADSIISTVNRALEQFKQA